MATSRLSDEKLGIDIMDTALITSMVDVKSIRKDRNSVISTENIIRYESNDVEFAGRPQVVANMEEIALKALHVDDGALNLAPSQLDLINDTILDKKLKTREVADVTRCSKRSIKAIHSNLHYLRTIKAPPSQMVAEGGVYGL